jgi:hypothetical protein
MIALALSVPAFAGLVALDTPLGSTDDVWLADVALDPLSGDAWVVGTSSETGDIDPIVAVWDGAAWTELSTPNGPFSHDHLTSIALTPDGAWAAGYSGEGGLAAIAPLVGWWDGAGWVETELPAVPYDAHLLWSVDALSADDAWVVGEMYDGVGGLGRASAWHWDGAAWSRVAVPNYGEGQRLYDVAVIATDDVWAAGIVYKDGAGRGVALHWDGAAWTAYPMTRGAVINSISASGPDDVWAVGSRTVNPGDGTGPVFLSYAAHWDGAAWTSYRLPQEGTGANFLNAVSVVSPTDAWAVGRFGAENDAGEWTSQTLALHWDGAAWSVVASESPGVWSNELWGVDALGGGQLMAVGDLNGVGSLDTQPLALVPE